MDSVRDEFGLCGFLSSRWRCETRANASISRFRDRPKMHRWACRFPRSLSKASRMHPMRARSGKVECSSPKQSRTTMKLATITLASAFVLSSTFALAYTTHPRHGSGVRTYQGYRGPYNSYARYRGPSNSYGPYNSYGRSGGLNGTADGPTGLVGGDTQGP